jgi:HPt (histidine-containing phosphotransfer) domain-containing protein
MLVHSLKSLAGTFGAEQLQDICGKLEAQLHARQCTPELLAQFDAELERLIAGLLPLLAEKI